ncbi:uroporphyrinogen-III synthase [Domibacillus robiginosus]|uniref:uroporphyrinogen-III synthase n=1 Tax=Domibacillus robiginosus TaxID=1071054 RepID=UPI00067DDE72|nr:uroporphyrinogen-III synthase [Domibacillus robiginosus]
MKPLAGKRIVVTRPRGQAAPFIGKIEEAGGTAYAVPLIAFRPSQDRQEEAILAALHTYDWILFTSKNGVDFFMQKAGHLLHKIGAKWAAIGTQTARAAEAYGLSVSYMPGRFSAEDMAEEIRNGLFLPKKMLVPKSSMARSVIADTVRQSGGQADEWIVYETYFPADEKEHLLEVIRMEKIDMITFTSPSAVRHFMQILKQSQEPLPDTDYGVIGRVTKKEALSNGIRVAVCPAVFTIDALVEEMGQFYKE